MNGPALLPQAWRLARRELRGGLHGFGVFLACLFLGVFAISAIGSFTAAAKAGLLADAGALLGGDLELKLVHRQLSEEQYAFLARAGTLSTVVELRAMAMANERHTLVELKAVDSNYPLYGRLALQPTQPLATALAPTPGTLGAVAEASLLKRLGLQVGDTLRVGQGSFLLSGIITAEPDRSLRPFSLGPRLLLSSAGLAATGLVQPGSLVSYAYRVRLPQREQVDALRQALAKAYPEAGWRLQSWRQATPRVAFFLDRMSTNLTLLGLCALLLGGLGVAGAVRGYLAGKVQHIAVMKCLGASGATIFTAYLLQVLLLGALGAGAGLVGGAALPFVLVRLLGKGLPLPLQPALFPEVLATAALFGLAIALLFSLKALGLARKVPPAVLFRGYGAADDDNPGRGIRLTLAGLAAALALLALAVSGDRHLAAGFMVGALLCGGIFRLLAATVIGSARRLPRPRSPRLRLGLANIARPGSPAGSILFSLGLGLTVLIIVTLVQANLDDMVQRTIPGEAPAFFFLDIQPEQVAAFESTVRAQPGVLRLERYPTLRGRISAINGVPAEQATVAPETQWAVRGDRFLSYAGAMPPGTELSAGAWWPPDYSGPPLVSLSADVAAGFGVTVGDTLTVNILGRKVTATIASLRTVDWSSLNLNFAILFAPGVLEAAPQTHLAAVHLAPGSEDGVFQAITGRFANISAIDTREVLANVARTLDRIGGAFKGMAAVALLTGFLVLSGAVGADQHRRIYDAVIFKVCGATRGDILGALLTEFLLLGLAAGAISAVVGSLAAAVILTRRLDLVFAPHPEVVLTTLAAGIALTLLLGLLGTWRALGQKPARYLRQD